MCLLINIAMCLIGAIISGVTGLCRSENCSYIEDFTNNRIFASLSLVFIIVCLVCSAIAIAVLCTCSHSFGVRLFTRGQYQVGVDNAALDVYVTGVDEVSATPVVPMTSSGLHHEHVHHPDPRLATPPPDFSTHHLQHYLTQQYKERIRKRRKRSKRRMKKPVDPHQAEAAEHVASFKNIHNHRLQELEKERNAPYVLPPLTEKGNGKGKRKRAPPPPSPSLDSQPETPPPVPHTLFPPPSPPHVGPGTHTTTIQVLPQYRPSNNSRQPPLPPPSTTPPPTPPSAEYTRAIFPISSTPPPPSVTPPSYTPPSAAVTPSPSTSLPGTPPPPPGSSPGSTATGSPPGLVHVIPYGGYTDEEEDGLAPYSLHDFWDVVCVMFGACPVDISGVC